MEKERSITIKKQFIAQMVQFLPVLRSAIHLTQKQLGAKLGVSRQTIVAIENKKSTLTWSLYLALVCVLQAYEDSKILLEHFNIYDINFIKKEL